MKLNKLGKKISFIFIMLVISLTLFLVNKNINVKAEENQNASSILNWVLTNNLPNGNYNVTVKGSTDGGKTEETITYPVELINYYDDVTYNSTDGENGVVELGDDTAEYKMLIVKYHKNLTINEGVTLTANTHTTTINSANYELTYKKGMYIHVSGTLTNNGTISMTARGTYNQKGENVYLIDNDDNTFEYVPATGGLGAASIQAPSGGATVGGTGTSGINRQTGGGGSGSAWYDSSISGAGGNGTSYSGGSGGAGVSRTGSSYTGNAGSSIGGPGGAGRAASHNDAGGGAGNPGGFGANGGTGNTTSGTKVGETGTGGLLILYSKTFENAGAILSNGSLGGTGDAGRAGSSGGGSINVFCDSCNSTGEMTANGGNYGNTNGGVGGNGTVTYKENLSQNNYLDSLTSNHGEIRP